MHKNLSKPPGRPIVSGIGSVFEPLSKFSDVFLRPILQATDTYLKDTKDVLRLLETVDFDPTRNILVSLDIESLYTSLPHRATLDVIEDVLFAQNWTYSTPRALVLECASVALTQNFFKFEDTL